MFTQFINPKKPWWTALIIKQEKDLTWTQKRISTAYIWQRNDGKRTNARYWHIDDGIDFVDKLKNDTTAGPAYEQMLVIDRNTPMPAPPPKVGQVWLDGAGIETLVVQSAPYEYAPWDRKVEYPNSVYKNDPWPPSNQQLMRGPGHPWTATPENWRTNGTS